MINIFFKGSNSKRLKLQSTDPLEKLHPHLFEYVFQHFDIADVMILSQVNTNWFNEIGKSLTAMKKIQLGLDNWGKFQTPSAMVNVMKNIRATTRQYQNLSIDCNNQEKVSREAVKLLEYFAPALINLKFLNPKNEAFDQHFNFPKLKTLQYFGCSRDAIEDLLMLNTANLEILDLENHYDANPVSLGKWVNRNAGLRTLKLCDCLSESFRCLEILNNDIKLRELVIGLEGSQEEKLSFLAFLSSGKTVNLQELTIKPGPSTSGASEDIINKVLELPALKKVRFDAFLSPENFTLIVNFRIIELRLPWNVDTVEKLKPFLRAVPKVEVLFLRKINMDILECLATNLKHLKFLYYTKGEGCVPCLQKILHWNQNYDVKFQIISKNWLS